MKFTIGWGSHRRGIGIVLSAIPLTLTLAAASPAPAAAPEFGRCEHVVYPKTGAYATEVCNTRSPSEKGEYDWIPGPGPKKGFSANWGTSFAPDAFLSTAHKNIDCPFNLSIGEYTGPKTVRMTVYLWQCHLPETQWEWQNTCQEVGAGNRAESEFGEIKLQAVGKLVFWDTPSGSKQVGVELRSASGSALAIFECGGSKGVGNLQYGTGTGTFYAIEGGVIAHILGATQTTRGTCCSTALNHMTLEYKTKFAAREGQQYPEKAEGEPQATLTLTSPTGKSSRRSQADV
jgi:hypothetical protein